LSRIKKGKTHSQKGEGKENIESQIRKTFLANALKEGEMDTSRLKGGHGSPCAQKKKDPNERGRTGPCSAAQGKGNEIPKNSREDMGDCAGSLSRCSRGEWEHNSDGAIQQPEGKKKKYGK